MKIESPDLSISSVRRNMLAERGSKPHSRAHGEGHDGAGISPRRDYKKERMS